MSPDLPIVTARLPTSTISAEGNAAPIKLAVASTVHNTNTIGATAFVLLLLLLSNSFINGEVLTENGRR